MSFASARFAGYAGLIQRALETPGPQRYNDPFAAAIHDLGESFRAYATPVQVRRFITAHRAWLSGVQWQIANRARERMPTLDQYLTMRLHSAGGEPTYAMLEIANRSEVPAAQMDSPAVCALTEMAILVAALDNDCHSLAKEISRQQAEQNIFNVLMCHDRCSPEEAVARSIALRDRVLCRFLTLRDRVLPHAGPALHLYLTGLGHGIRGNIDWGLRVSRYLSLRDAVTGPENVPPRSMSGAPDAPPMPTPIPCLLRPSVGGGVPSLRTNESPVTMLAVGRAADPQKGGLIRGGGAGRSPAPRATCCANPRTGCDDASGTPGGAIRTVPAVLAVRPAAGGGGGQGRVSGCTAMVRVA